MVYRFFDKITRSGVSVNEELAEELHKSLIEKFERRKVYARFNANIWAVYLAEIGSWFFFDLGVNYLLCAIDFFTKYAEIKPFKDKKYKAVFYSFIKRVNESKRNVSKLWVNHKQELYNSFMQKWLHNNDILMYYTHNEGTSVVTELFIRTFKC